MDDMEDFIETPNDDQLLKVAELANQLICLREDITEIVLKLKKLQEEERELSQQELPELMKSLGLKDFTLVEGTKLSITHKVKAHLSKAKRDEAFQWLRDNGHGALIKEKRIVEESVHANTLTAFVREQLRKGEAIPTSLFGVYEYDETTIKLP